MKRIRLILAVSILSLTVLMAGSCDFFKPEHRVIDSPVFNFIGEMDAARQRLSSAEDSYGKNFLLACFELTEGNLDAARSYTQRVVEDRPDIPDGRVLTFLIDQREAHPDEPWVDSYVSAWKEAGSPSKLMSILDFPFPTPYDDLFSFNIFSSSELLSSVQDTPDELLIGTLDEEGSGLRRIRLAMKYSGPDMPIEIRLLALNILNAKYYYMTHESIIESEREEYPDELKQELKFKRRQLLEQLSSEFPDIMEFELSLFIDDTMDKEVLDESDIARLEKITDKGRLSFDRQELYEKYRKRFTALGLKYNKVVSASTDKSIKLFGSYLYLAVSEFRKKISKTAESVPEEIYIRLARILKDLAEKYIARKTYTDIMFGLSYLFQYAEIMSDEDMKSSLEQTSVFFRAFAKAAYPASAASWWPIYPLNVEALELSMKDGIQFYMLFSDDPMPEAVAELLGY